MICNICGLKESTIHLTEIVNDQMVEIHLCQDCAQEKGTDFKTHFNFEDLLAGLSGLDVEGPAVKNRQAAALMCSECGMTYDEFSKGGRLGCAGCYQAFQKMLIPLIKRVQRSAHHIGKKPSRLSKSERNTVDLRSLQDQLRKSVDMEEFEKAAKIRDAIKKLEEKQKKGKKK